WTADGVVSERWAPTSPVTGALDAFQWRVPVEAVSASEATLLGQKLEELMKPSLEPDVLDRAPVIDASTSASSGEAIHATDAEVVEEPREPEAEASKAPPKPAPSSPMPEAKAQKPAEPAEPA